MGIQHLSHLLHPATATKIESSLWKQTAQKFRQQGVELLEIHRQMYLAAIDEGHTRQTESKFILSPQNMHRLSCFRVKNYFDQINSSIAGLHQWSSSSVNELPENWEYTLPLKVGDEVEADLGGAFFSATVTRASSNSFDVQFFDGDIETGLPRDMIKLLSPPDNDSSDVDTSKMTKKELKRWKKKQKKVMQ